MKYMFPDYKNCLVNLSNSILKHFGVETTHSTLPELDSILEKKYKNVLLLLFDGMGSNLILQHLGPDSFFNQHKVKDITSVFPATTTAATTAVITGKTPAEHCWLGWDVYIKSLDKIVTLYRNVEKGSDVPLSNESVAFQEFPFQTIFEKIKAAGKANAYCVSPFDGLKYSLAEPDEMYNTIKKLCKIEEHKFIYAYCTEPDHLMHDFGTNHDAVLHIFEQIQMKVQQLSKELTDTLMIVTADHGHMSVSANIVLDNYPEIQSRLIRRTSIEARATNFFVKPEYLVEFRKTFMEYFQHDFLLYTKQEVIDQKLFGDGEIHPKFESCLGDYLAIAIGDKSIMDEWDPYPLKGCHAGLLEEEVKIPFIIIKT